MERKLSGASPKLGRFPGTCDTHLHFYDDRYRPLPGTPSPPAASVADYRKVMNWLGIERAVVVQPNAYGDNNSCTMDAVKQLGPAARAVVVVRRGISDDAMADLTRAGARGIRFMSLLGGTLSWADMDEMGQRAHAHGWHAIVQLDGRTLPEHEDQIRRLPGRFVIDHIGKFLEPVRSDHPGFKSLLGLLDTGRCWLKLSAPYEFSKTGGPDYADIAVPARILIRHAPDRMIWATNWPHAQANIYGYPDEAALYDCLLGWADDDNVRRKILVSNPAELYGF